MSLSDIPLRAQTLGGQIKQADADVAEADVRLHRARSALEIAEREQAQKKERAQQLRNDLVALREEATAAIDKLGVVDDAPPCDHRVIERALVPGRPENVRRCGCGVLVELNADQMARLETEAA